MKGTPTQNYNDCDYTPAVTDSALSACFQYSMPTLGATFLGGRFARSVTLLVLSWLILASMSPSQSESALLPAPGQIGEVACVSDRTQTYALYVPSSYTPGKRWPIIYFFDPSGRGRRPLDLYKEIAETYGFILAGSNNSRNFSSNQSASVNAVWVDTQQRFSIDEHRIYSSGFSGGARVAGAMALNCPQCQIAGVIAHGAGYPTNHTDSKDKLLYFLAVGTRDFNWPEVVTIRRQREDRGQPYRVDVFDGSHQWAPPEVMEDAIQWLTLHAMQQEVMSADPAFIEKRFRRMESELQGAQKKNDPIAQFSAYRSLVSDFAGFRPVDEFTKAFAELKQSAALKKALQNEKNDINEQFALEREISPKLRKYLEGKSDDARALSLEIVRAMAALKNQAAHAKDEQKRLIYARAYDDMRVEGMENGQQELEGGHFARAEDCFELMAQVSDDPWPHLLLAETHALSGNRTQAMRDLQDAVKHGLKDPEVLESDPRLQTLKSDAAFRKLLLDLKHP